MKKGLVILWLGLFAAVAAYGCIYFACTASSRGLRASEQPELAWLKEEFKLSDTDFTRVSELHASYLPQCRHMCREIDAQNARLQELLSSATSLTPAITIALGEGARLHSECQAMMLRHFLQVSQSMPPEQGRRYLAWVKQKAFQPQSDMPKH